MEFLGRLDLPIFGTGDSIQSETGLLSRCRGLTLVEPLIIEQGLDSDKSARCAMSASSECLKSRGESHRLRTGSPEHRSTAPAGRSLLRYF